MAASERADVEKRLAEAEQMISDGMEEIERLEGQIADLALAGLLTPSPLALLSSFKKSQASYVANRDWLRSRLAQSDGS